MKISSASSSSIEHTLKANHAVDSLLSMVQHTIRSLMRTVNHVGTSIALGESGDLDAAHEFRNKNSGRL